MMTVDDVQVFLPGEDEPVSLDHYADYMALVAGCGTYEQSLSVPAFFHYENPLSGNSCTIGTTPGDER